MNRQDLSNVGGHPLTLNDLSFALLAQQDENKGSLSFLKGLCPSDVVVLSGCVITIAGPNFTHTDGYVWLNNEVFYVPANAVPRATNLTFEFNIVETVDATGTKTYYGGGAPHQTRFVRTCTIDANNAGTLYTFTDDNYYTPKWTVATYASGWGGTVRYRKRLGLVELDLSATIAAMGAGQRAIFTLPPAHYPSVDKFFPVYGLDNAVDATIFIKVSSATGIVSVLGGATAVSKTVYLRPVSFYTV